MTKFRSIISVIAMCGIMWLTVQVTIVWLEYKAFSRSPSSSVPVPAAQAGPGHIIISIVDLQRELNRRDPKLKLKEDGVYGALTRAAHEKAIGNQYAKELR